MLGKQATDWAYHLWFGFGFGKFPLKITNFSIFSLRIKKFSLGRVKKYGQRRVSLLFSPGQKYDLVGSGQALSLLFVNILFILSFSTACNKIDMDWMVLA